VFFPTGYPDRKHPDTGLVASQQEELTKVAKVFPKSCTQDEVVFLDAAFQEISETRPPRFSLGPT
jgi:hypothetical protein